MCREIPDRYNSIGFQVRLLHNLIGRSVEKSMRSAGNEDLTTMHTWIIRYVGSFNGEDVFQKDVEAQFDISGATASTILQRMVKNGYLKKEPVPYDDRLKKLLLTERSISFLKQQEQLIEKTEEALRDGISKEELDSFFACMDKIRENAIKMSGGENGNN